MDFSRTSDAVVIPEWPAPAQVRALVTTRRLPGNSLPPFDAFNLGLRSGESEDVVRSNRALLARALGLPSAPKWLRQVHGAKVVVTDRPPSSGSVSPNTRDGKAVDVFSEVRSDDCVEPEGDAAVARERGVVLAILSADCLPVLLCADDGSEVAAAHAGWRGLSAGVIESCVARMRTAPARLMAWLGPAIGPRSYEVGDEVRATFVAAHESATTAFAPTRPGHWLCNLYTLARQRLHNLGVTGIYGGDFDTFADARFYSWRRDGAASGRMTSLIWIAGSGERV